MNNRIIAGNSINCSRSLIKKLYTSQTRYYYLCFNKFKNACENQTRIFKNYLKLLRILKVIIFVRFTVINLNIFI